MLPNVFLWLRTTLASYPRSRGDSALKCCMGFGWEGDLARLVPIDVDKHLENAVAWVNDSEVTRYLMVGDFPITKLSERDWFEKQSKDSETHVFFAIETFDGKHIGFSDIHGINWRHGTGSTGSMIGDRGEWGKGFGSDAAKTRNRYVFDVLGLRAIYSSALDGNARSLGMLKRAGYREYGRRPKALWKRGTYVDEVLLFLDRETWEQSESVGNIEK